MILLNYIIKVNYDIIKVIYDIVKEDHDIIKMLMILGIIHVIGNLKTFGML